MNNDNIIQNMTVTFRGDPEPVEFYGIISYQLGSGFLGVLDKDGTMHIYPSDRIEGAVLTQQAA